MEKKLIELKNISKEFDDEQVLKAIDLDIHDKEFITLLGPSGCGKTTTLRITAVLCPPTAARSCLTASASTTCRPISAW